MVRKIIVLSAAVAVVLCFLVCAWAVRGYFRQEDRLLGSAVLKEGSCETIPAPVPVRKLAKSPRTGQMYWGIAHDKGLLRDCAYRVKTPKRIEATPEQSNDVARVFAEILESYKNNDVEGMRTSMKDIPDIVTNMTDKVFAELKSPLCVALQNRFIGLQSPLEFADVESLDVYLESNIELTIFLGNIALRRVDFGAMVDIYDWLVLRRLLQYKNKYHDQGDEKFEACVDRPR